jgi:hypothetical protein
MAQPEMKVVQILPYIFTPTYFSVQRQLPVAHPSHSVLPFGATAGELARQDKQDQFFNQEGQDSHEE